MPAKPLILITPSTQARGAEFADPSISLSHTYAAAIAAAGGLPWILPCLPNRRLIRETMRRCDGAVLTGGDDVEPRLYNGTLLRQVERTIVRAAPARDLLELLVIEAVFRLRKPLLAICRGQQILNVACGGELIADIPLQHPSSLNHNQLDLKDEPVHPVTLKRGSAVRRLLRRASIRVNSTHHQAVKEPAAPFQATAHARDGLVEAMELRPELRDWLPFCLSVQFHPERMTHQSPDFNRLFRGFVRACRPAGTRRA